MTDRTLTEWEARHSGDDAEIPLIEPPLAPWRIFHRHCDPHPDGDSAYWFDLHRINTAERAVDWTAHLLEKRWLHLTDWTGLLRYLQRSYDWRVDA